MTTQDKLLEVANALGLMAGHALVWGSFLALKAWLLVLVLSWFGVTALGFWQAAVALVLLDLLLGTRIERK